MILADMEGCCGIHDLSDEAYCISCMTAEVDYIIHVLQAFTSCEITVLDCHNDGHSLQTYCKMKQIPIVNHVWSLRSKEYDMALLIGFHGMHGQSGILSQIDRELVNQDMIAHGILSQKDWRRLTDSEFLYLTELAKGIEAHSKTYV